MVTAVAAEILNAQGQALPGIVGKLETDDGMLLLMIVANDHGYDVFKRVPLPFVGRLTLQALDSDGHVYVQPVSIPDGAVNVTLRVGGQKVNPDDLVLRAAVPFA